MKNLLVQDNNPEMLIAVNSTGGISLAQSATREKLAVWIVKNELAQQPTWSSVAGNTYRNATSIFGSLIIFFYLTMKFREWWRS